MIAPRSLALLGCTAACAAALVPAAAAAPRPTGSYAETKSTAHFTVHYTGDFASSDRITHQQASDLAARLEQAYERLVTDWGYPAPRDDGDGRSDVWVLELGPGGLGSVYPDGVAAAANPTTAWMVLDPESITAVDTITHELLHLIQLGIWRPSDDWLLEGSAEWAGFVASNYVPFGGGSLLTTLGEPDMSLDCVGDACGNDLYETGGYSRWTFFEYVADRFGTAFVRDVLARGATLANASLGGAALLDSALVQRGTTLADVFNDYAAASLVSGYGVTALEDVAPPSHSATSTGVSTATLPVQRVAVNRLATKFLRFDRGLTQSALCHSASLALTVAIPAGVSSKPVFYSKALGAQTQPFAVSGSTATLTVPWNTCFGGSPGYLALPNGSMTTDAGLFTVSGTITVDTSSVNAAAAPPEAIYVGPVVPGAAADVAPSIFVHGAQVLRVSASKRLVRLIVFSSGSGTLRAAVGSARVGEFALRAGNNDIRFRLPVRTVTALRTTSARRAAGPALSLTSYSTAGTKGATVKRKLAVTRAKRR